ncbi:MAG: DUF2520 domain-containing protein [Bifidobacteriaceae bacterium]|nr:DUF2520 domain-containing protein [Bifidobacteriaceae bacterium]
MAGESLAVGVIGFGRVGAAFASALHAAGHPVAAVAARSEAAKERADVALPGVPVLTPAAVVEAAGLVFVTVPDDAIALTVAGLDGHWRPGQVVVHASGALGLDALAPAAAVGAITLVLHPAMTFTGTSLDVARLRGAPFAVSAPAGLDPLAVALAQEMGGLPFTLSDDRRALYHAALCHAANHLVTLVSQARDMLAAAGLDDAEFVLGPLTRAALDGALRRGFEALTGPAARGDAATLAAHAEALRGYAAARGALLEGPVALGDEAQAALDAVATYAALSRATVDGAERAGRIGAEAARQARDAIEHLAPPGQEGRNHG